MLETINKILVKPDLIGVSPQYSNQLNVKRLSNLRLRINAGREDDRGLDSWVEDNFIFIAFNTGNSDEFIVDMLMSYNSYLREYMIIAENQLIERAAKLKRSITICSNDDKLRAKRFLLDALRDIYMPTIFYQKYVEEIQRFNCIPGSRNKWLRLNIKYGLVLTDRGIVANIKASIVYSIPGAKYGRDVTVIKKL